MIHRYLRLTENGRVNYRKAYRQVWTRFEIKSQKYATEYDEAYRKHLRWLKHPTLFDDDD